MTALLVIGLFVIITIIASVKTVPENSTFIVERFGKYNRTLYSGLNFIIPFLDTVAYKRTLKEQVFDVPSQDVITKDNISIKIDGVVYVKTVDAKKSCYGIENYEYAISQIAQTTMRSEIGKLSLEKTFEEREKLNAAIVHSINEAAEQWGIMILRYEIKDITPPASILSAMEIQLKADREKRAVILESEGEKQSAINHAEGAKQSAIKHAEGEKESKIIEAQGEAESILLVANAQAESLRVIGEQATSDNGVAAIKLTLAEKAILAKEAIAKESSLVVIPDSSTDIASTVIQAMAINEKLKS